MNPWVSNRALLSRYLFYRLPHLIMHHSAFFYLTLDGAFYHDVLFQRLCRKNIELLKIFREGQLTIGTFQEKPIDVLDFGKNNWLSSSINFSVKNVEYWEYADNEFLEFPGLDIWLSGHSQLNFREIQFSTRIFWKKPLTIIEFLMKILSWVSILEVAKFHFIIVTSTCTHLFDMTDGYKRL